MSFEAIACTPRLAMRLFFKTRHSSLTGRFISICLINVSSIILLEFAVSDSSVS